MSSKPIASYDTANPRDDAVVCQEPILRLHRNESRTTLNPQFFAALEAQDWQRYPDASALAASLAKKLAVDPNRVVITAGGDEGIDRAIRRALRGTRRKVLTHSPAFDMFPIYTQNANGEFVGINWLDGDFPTDEFLRQIDADTALVILVSPNNPTGRAIAREAWEKVLDRTRRLQIPVLADLAYIEYATESPAEALLNDPQVTIVRTFSKAWGLAGLRVGYLIAPDLQTADELRAMGGPFPVSGVSLSLAQLALETQSPLMHQHVLLTRQLRQALSELLKAAGAQPLPSEGNFVLAHWNHAGHVAEALRAKNIWVRTFAPPHPLAGNWMRITCPETWDQLKRLQRALGIESSSIESLSVPASEIATTGNQPVEVQAASGDSQSSAAESRSARVERSTKETTIELAVALDGRGQVEVSTGLGFFDHMMTALGHHARFDLRLNCRGDLHVDDHHTIEDCGLALGTALDRALGDRRGIRRFGYAYAPLDEAVARCVIDLSGRAFSFVDLQLVRETIGNVATENLTHFFQSLAQNLRCALHLEILAGQNDHHRAEAAFKATALALRQAVEQIHREIPSTKGVLS